MILLITSKPFYNLNSKHKSSHEHFWELPVNAIHNDLMFSETLFWEKKIMGEINRGSFMSGVSFFDTTRRLHFSYSTDDFITSKNVDILN